MANRHLGMPDLEDDKLKRKPLRMEVYSLLRQSIVTGRLKPGQRVTEIDLVNHLGVSRTPIREALMHLEKEGLITMDPGRGAVVSDISKFDLDEIYPIVGALEGLAARLAVANLTDQDIQKLKELNMQLKKSAKNEEVSTYMQLNGEFHQLYIDKSSNQRLSNLLSTYKEQIYRFRLFSLSMPNRMKLSVKEHADLVEAFRRRDANLVERLVRQHVEHGRESLEGVLQSVATTPVLASSSGAFGALGGTR